MAVAVDASLGNASNSATGITLDLVTSAAVAANSVIVVGTVNYNATAVLSSVSGGSLTWTVIGNHKNAGDHQRAALAWAAAPSGLASGTTLTATWSATTIDRAIMAVAFSGVATTSPVEDSGGSDGTTLAWDSATMDTLTSGALLVAAYRPNSSSAGHTIDAPSVEDYDFNIGGTSSTAVYAHRIVGAAGPYTISGDVTSLGGFWVAYTAALKEATPSPPVVRSNLRLI